MKEHRALQAPQFSLEEEVIGKGAFVKEGSKYSYECLGVVQEIRLTPRRGYRYGIRLYTGHTRFFYEKSVEKANKKSR